MVIWIDLSYVAIGFMHPSSLPLTRNTPFTRLLILSSRDLDS
uniref:Uncharacterized protein n=1 Tax=Lepeophtheirus salmonis TaxID=72036 RepID=A0A0K2TGW6_LEPSM